MIKRLSILSLFFILLCFYANGQDNAKADQYVKLAEECRKNQKQDSAIYYYEKASVEYKNAGNVEKEIASYNQIGIILTRQDKYDSAKNYLDKALATGLSSLDSNNLEIATTYISLGVVYNAEEKYAVSLKYHYKALAIRLLKLGENDVQTATSYGNIGNVLRNNKEYEKSIAAHTKAMEIRKKIYGEMSPEITESYVGLGNAYKEKKEYTIALEYFDKALKNKIIQRGEGHKELAKFYKYLRDVCYMMGDKKQGDIYNSKYEAVM